MLLGTGIIAVKERENQPKVKLLQLSYCNNLVYDLRVESIDQVFVLKMPIIFVIPEKFYMKNCQFVQL